MQKILKTFSLLFILAISNVFLLACHPKDDPHTLKVGTIAGPETTLMETAAKVAKEKYGLTLRIIAFSDYLEPNAALHDGSIDANLFQHQPWLDRQNKEHRYHLVAVGKAFIYPMGIYPGKSHSLLALPQKAKIAIPNDPSNEGRALLLLANAGLIQLNPKAGIYPTQKDIIENPREIEFIELDAAQLTRSLPDVDAAAINTNYAVQAGLDPARDALWKEGPDSPYANIIVVRQDKKKDPRVKQLIAAFQSDAVILEAKKLFGSQAIRAW